MSVISSLVLTNQHPKNTYTASVVTSASLLADGLGNQITSLFVTTSYATNSDTASMCLDIRAGGYNSSGGTGSVVTFSPPFSNNVYSVALLGVGSALSASYIDNQLAGGFTTHYYTSSATVKWMAIYNRS